VLSRSHARAEVKSCFGDWVLVLVGSEVVNRTMPTFSVRGQVTQAEKALVPCAVNNQTLFL
jgi:hypothetical protein